MMSRAAVPSSPPPFSTPPPPSVQLPYHDAIKAEFGHLFQHHQQQQPESPTTQPAVETNAEELSKLLPVTKTCQGHTIRGPIPSDGLNRTGTVSSPSTSSSEEVHHNHWTFDYDWYAFLGTGGYVEVTINGERVSRDYAIVKEKEELKCDQEFNSSWWPSDLQTSDLNGSLWSWNWPETQTTQTGQSYFLGVKKKGNQYLKEGDLRYDLALFPHYLGCDQAVELLVVGQRGTLSGSFYPKTARNNTNATQGFLGGFWHWLYFRGTGTGRSLVLRTSTASSITPKVFRGSCQNETGMEQLYTDILSDNYWSSWPKLEPTLEGEIYYLRFDDTSYGEETVINIFLDEPDQGYQNATNIVLDQPMVELSFNNSNQSAAPTALSCYLTLPNKVRWPQEVRWVAFEGNGGFVSLVVCSSFQPVDLPMFLVYYGARSDREIQCLPKEKWKWGYAYDKSCRLLYFATERNQTYFAAVPAQTNHSAVITSGVYDWYGNPNNVCDQVTPVELNGTVLTIDLDVNNTQRMVLGDSVLPPTTRLLSFRAESDYVEFNRDIHMFSGTCSQEGGFWSRDWKPSQRYRGFYEWSVTPGNVYYVAIHANSLPQQYEIAAFHYFYWWTNGVGCAGSIPALTETTTSFPAAKGTLAGGICAWESAGPLAVYSIEVPTAAWLERMDVYVSMNTTNARQKTRVVLLQGWTCDGSDGSATVCRASGSSGQWINSSNRVSPLGNTRNLHLLVQEEYDPANTALWMGNVTVKIIRHPEPMESELMELDEPTATGSSNSGGWRLSTLAPVQLFYLASWLAGELVL